MFINMAEIRCNIQKITAPILVVKEMEKLYRHYELEVSFCVARDAAVPQSITCIVARD